MQIRLSVNGIIGNIDTNNYFASSLCNTAFKHNAQLFRFRWWELWKLLKHDILKSGDYGNSATRSKSNAMSLLRAMFIGIFWRWANAEQQNAGKPVSPVSNTLNTFRLNEMCVLRKTFVHWICQCGRNSSFKLLWSAIHRTVSFLCNLLTLRKRGFPLCIAFRSRWMKCRNLLAICASQNSVVDKDEIPVPFLNLLFVLLLWACYSCKQVQLTWSKARIVNVRFESISPKTRITHFVQIIKSMTPHNAVFWQTIQIY